MKNSYLLSMNRIVSFCLLLCVLVLIGSCNKDEITLITQQINSNTNYELSSIFYATDSVVYAAGGSEYGIGVIIRSTDGGYTWSTPDSIMPKEIYALYFFNAADGVAGGFNSYWTSTTDSGKTYSTANASNWVSINAIGFMNQNVGIKVGGDGIANGYIATTINGGNNWNYYSVPGNLTALEYVDSNNVFTSGYGEVYKSEDGGLSFQATEARGDFFLGLDFPTPNTGYFAGFEGMILKTTDDGNSFSKVRKGNAPFAKRVHFETIKFWDEDNGFVAGAAGVMYKTSDGGKTWEEVKPFTSETLRAIHLFSATSGIVVGDNGGIFMFQQ